MFKSRTYSNTGARSKFVSYISPSSREDRFTLREQKRERERQCIQCDVTSAFNVTSPHWAYFMLTYDVCTYEADVRNGNFSYAYKVYKIFSTTFSDVQRSRFCSRNVQPYLPFILTNTHETLYVDRVMCSLVPRR